MFLRKYKSVAVLLVFILFMMSPVAEAAKQNQSVAYGTTYVVLYVDQKETYLNGEEVVLDVATTVINGRTYVPAKFLGDAFGMKVEWDAQTRKIIMETPKHRIIFDQFNKTVDVNGKAYPFNEVATIKNDRLMLKLIWLAEFTGATYTYNAELRRVDVVHVNKPESIYDPNQNNSKPVAKFTFAKPAYKLGEPVKYVDLSYDPDSEGGAKYKWEGREEAFFKAGTYPITLTVTDVNGNVSEPFTREITIVDEVYLSKTEYPIFTQPAGSYIKTDWKTLYASFLNLPELEKKVTGDDSRSILLSDSPETVTEHGILYQDKVKGKARLYGSHMNGTEKLMAFSIIARNMTNEPVTIKTTNKGEVYPSIYALLIGNRATVDFMLNDPLDERMVIPPGEAFVYKKFPDFYPGQGVNVIYDVETSGEVEFTFAASAESSTVSETLKLPKLPFNGHIRGTFPITTFNWDIDVSKKGLPSPKVLIFGDGKSDPFQPGFDPLRGTETKLSGNYGTVYKIHSDKPTKMAIMILARGGPFKGAFKINGEIRNVPESGVLTAFDGMRILAKTTGKEESLDIEFSPPAGSAFPITMIFYPLDERAQ